MRPIRLKVKGFTSFRDEQEISFDGLDVFAICGPTGSGKSSLLDAMTYALYGVVERVGKQVSQLVGHGQPGLAVEFEFASGDERYRIVRSMRASGTTKIRLERMEGDEWISAGEDADRVAGVNKRIHEIIGIDYDAFTRSVLLPQGKFQEFLIGEASKRREILSDLLGLSLFKQMAQRAGEIAREAEQQGNTIAAVIEQQFGDATPEAFTAAKVGIERAVERHEALQKTAERVSQIAERWAATRSIVGELDACAADALAIENVARAVADRVSAIDFVALAAREKEAASTLGAGAKAEETATKKRATAEERWGSVAVLAEARGSATQLAALRDDAHRSADALMAATKEEPALAAAVAAAQEQAAALTAELSAADRMLDEAREAYTREHAVSIACTGIHEGDPCPVCGTTLTITPKPATELAKAKKAGEKLKTDREALDKKVRAAEAAHVRADGELKAATRERARLEKESATRAAAVDAAEKKLKTFFGASIPADPAAELGTRLHALEDLVAAERAAADARIAAEKSAAEVARGTDTARASIETERARLGAQPVDSLAKRARTAAGDALATPEMPAIATLEPAALGAAARTLADACDEMRAALAQAAAAHGAGEQAMLAEAREVVGDLLPMARTFEELLGALTKAVADANAAVAGARSDAKAIEANLAKRAELVAQVTALGARVDRFKALAQELRADRLIAFLQSEALTVLCAVGTHHLLRLSDDRYRLECVEDEFLVVDMWNGEETRSVKTLSGGETFMASLALALALSERVQALSVARRARLDSLFLDEGFGTLDPDRLQEVTDAIGQLAEGGRMVGVITHIAELADQLPATIRVEKSPHGSRIVMPA